MITGETEFLMMRDPEDGYDNFLFFGKKAKARRQERKAQRQAEGRKPGRGLMDLLSSPGLGDTINNVAGLFTKKGSETPSDYQVSVGGAGYDDSNDEEPKKDNTMLIVGGVIVAGILILGFTQIKKNKTIQPAL
ncbi:hypothetical protein LVD17_28250 [Fulvivirga ulvae]|uniref:hypothetical protein n=1 Tax=Fulvivirga ulvae TaxID=2904245 RepID=UPI001F2BEFB6|nr:hypothetical protein [Fulvivirga ulvae]UII32181.1 hypothetical protein LVD17_28250 [Fulvivirga ulvae]